MPGLQQVRAAQLHRHSHQPQAPPVRPGRRGEDLRRHVAAGVQGRLGDPGGAAGPRGGAEHAQGGRGGHCFSRGRVHEPDVRRQGRQRPPVFHRDEHAQLRPAAGQGGRGVHLPRRGQRGHQRGCGVDRDHAGGDELPPADEPAPDLRDDRHAPDPDVRGERDAGGDRLDWFQAAGAVRRAGGCQLHRGRAVPVRGGRDAGAVPEREPGRPGVQAHLDPPEPLQPRADPADPAGAELPRRPADLSVRDRHVDGGHPHDAVHGPV